MKLKCKNYGLLTNTEVENEDGRVLVTNGLSIEQLVDLWRWYYNIAPWKRIELEVDKRLYETMKQKSLSAFKGVQELFYENNVVVVKVEE